MKGNSLSLRASSENLSEFQPKKSKPVPLKPGSHQTGYNSSRVPHKRKTDRSLLV
jgi:hypothetical protein